MSYDPYRDTTPNNTTPPREPFQNFERDPDGGTGSSFLLGALVLVALGGFIYYYAGLDNPNTAANDIRPPVTQPSTTGSAPATDAPATATPPAPAR